MTKMMDRPTRPDTESPGEDAIRSIYLTLQPGAGKLGRDPVAVPRYLTKSSIEELLAYTFDSEGTIHTRLKNGNSNGRVSSGSIEYEGILGEVGITFGLTKDQFGDKRREYRFDITGQPNVIEFVLGKLVSDNNQLEAILGEYSVSNRPMPD